MADSTKKKALVIGAGSGRDIASSVLITEELRKQGMDIDLAGFLTPWALHSFNGKIEKPVNLLVSGSKKFTPGKEGIYLASYFEPALLRLNKKCNLGIKNFYLFSLQYGIGKLQKEINELVARDAYDLIIIVDIGGDILAEKRDYPSLLTPIVDLSCLSLFKNINTKAEVCLAVIAPGADGEIGLKRLTEIFKKLQKNKTILEISSYQPEDFRKFIEINMEIEKRTSSYSNTFRVIRRSVGFAKAHHFTEKFVKLIRINGKEWQIPRSVRLNSGFLNKIYYLDFKRLKKHIHDLHYSGVMGAFVKLKKRRVGGTEIDLSYVKHNGQVFFLLTPGDYIKPKERKKIIGYGLKLVSGGIISRALMLKKDIKKIHLMQGIQTKGGKSGLCLVTRLRKTRRLPQALV